jgi:hypothetical protein
MTLECERDAVSDTQGSKEAPSAEEPALARREAHVFHRHQAIIVKDIVMDHRLSLRALQQF